MDAIKRGIEYAVQKGGTVVIVQPMIAGTSWKKKWSSNADFVQMMSECEHAF